MLPGCDLLWQLDASEAVGHCFEQSAQFGAEKIDAVVVVVVAGQTVGTFLGWILEEVDLEAQVVVVAAVVVVQGILRTSQGN